MKKLLFLSVMILPLLGYSQSLVFCPKIDVANISNIEGDAYVVIKDSRTHEKKLKEKCSKEELIVELSNYIEQSFPKMNITFLLENQFSEKPKENRITFKIDIAKYDVTFYTGMYVSFTKFLIEIYDFRNGEKIYDRECNGKGSQLNFLGYKSAKIASNSGFKVAFNEFTTIFENRMKGKL
jgi:hypothetical protein